jgi:hypothetical protein
MKREDRYIVLKLSDIEFLDEYESEQLAGVCDIIRDIREKCGKRDLRCVVVEDDWPEYETVWDMIEARVDGECESCTIRKHMGYVPGESIIPAPAPHKRPPGR